MRQKMADSVDVDLMGSVTPRMNVGKLRQKRVEHKEPNTPTSLAKVISRLAAIAFSSFQNGSSRLTLVL
jgi:hypothetical protein